MSKSRSVDMLDNFTEAVGSQRLKDLLVGAVQTYADLPATGVPGKLYLVRSDETNKNKTTLYSFENGVYTMASGGGGGEGLATIDLVQATNLLYNSFRDAESRNAVKYRQKNMVIDVQTDISGWDTNMGSIPALTDGAIRNGEVDVTPVMTAANAPAPYVVSSDVFYTTNEPWKAFDESTGTNWYVSPVAPADVVLGHWLKIDLGVARTISKIRLTAFIYSASYTTIKDWKLWGSNDDVNWTQIGQGTQPMNTAPVEYMLNNNKAYRFYRLSQPGGAYNNVNAAGVADMKLFEAKPTSNFVTKPETFTAAPKKLLVVCESTAPLSFDVTLDDGANWKTDLQPNTLIDLSDAVIGSALRLRTSMDVQQLQSLGYLWYDEISMNPVIRSEEEINDRLNDLENTTQTQFKTFVEDFRTQNLIDKAATDATAGWGYVRPDRLAAFFEDYSTDTYLDAVNSQGVTVDTTAKKLTLAAGGTSGIAVSTAQITQGTKYATLTASVNHKSTLAFSSYTKLSDTNLTNDHVGVCTIVDRTGRTWYVWQVVAAAPTGGVYAKVINSDGTVAFNGQIASVGIVPQGLYAQVPITRLAVDFNNRVWIILSYYFTNNALQSAYLAVNPDFTVFQALTLVGTNATGYTYFNDVYVDKNNRIWLAYGCNYSTYSWFRVLNADGTVFVAQTYFGSNSTNNVRILYDSVRDRILIANIYTSQARFNPYTLAGASLQASVVVSIPGANASASAQFFNAVYTGTDKIIVFMRSAATPVTVMFATVNPANFTLVGTPTALPGVTNVPEGYPSILVRQNDYLFVYPTTVDSSSVTTLHAIGLRDDGTVSEPDIPVNAGDTSSNHLCPTAYMDTDGNIKITYQSKKYSEYFTIEEAAYVNTTSTVSFTMSVDDGLSWSPATLGEQITFPSSGTQVRVRISLTAPAVGYSPEIVSYSFSEGNDTTNPGITRTFFSSPLPSVAPIHKASLSATVDVSGGGTVDWFLTNDGGINWYPVSLGQQLTFQNALGADLRVKAVMTYPAAATKPPVINGYTITSVVVRNGLVDTRVVCEASLVYSAPQSFTAGVATKLAYSRVINDSHQAYDPNNYQFTVPKDGWYMISATGNFNNNYTAPMRAFLVLFRNNYGVAVMYNVYHSTVGTPSFLGTTMFYLNMGDVIDLRVTTDKAVALYPTPNQSSADTWNYIRIVEMKQ